MPLPDRVRRTLDALVREIQSDPEPLSDDDLRDLIDARFREGDGTTEDLLRELKARLQAPAPTRSANRMQGGRGTPAQNPGGRGSGRRQIPDDFAERLTAPFRFIAIEDRVVPGRPADLDTPLPGGFSGRIVVEWVAETPLLVGAETEEQGSAVSVPLRLPDGTPIIPGASLRGMLRSAVEIVTLGRLSQVNAHHRFPLRDFFHPHYASESGRQTWETWHCGWLERRVDPATGATFYCLTECDRRAILIRRLPDSLNGGKPTDTAKFHLDWLRRPIEARYGAAGMRCGSVIDFRQTISIRLLDERTVEAAAASSDAGVLVFSGRSPLPKDLEPETLQEEHVGVRADGEPVPKERRQKRREHVFLDRPGAPEHRLTEAEFARFEMMHSRPASTRGRGGREPEGNYAVLRPTLESPGGRIPVFYLGTPGRPDFQMGLTRALKIGHRYSVGEKLRARHPAHDLTRDAEPDWVEALFGWVHEAEDLGLTPAEAEARERAHPGTLARRGRVAFGMARPTTAHTLWPAANTSPIRTTMMAPRASFAPFYLAGQGEKDWSDPQSNLAGRKGYFPRYVPGGADARQTVERQVTPSAGAATESRLRFLVPAGQPELRFQGTIRIHNLSAAELGALLWVLTHGGDPAKPCRYMLGRGKPFGAGQMRVRSVSLALTPHDAAAKRSLTAAEEWERLGEQGGRETGWVPAGGVSLAPFLLAFHEAMDAACSNRWLDTDSVREWLALSDPQAMATARSDYLGLRRENGRLVQRPDAPRRHGELKRTVQLSTRDPPPPPAAAAPRLLASPARDRTAGRRWPYQPGK